MMGAVVYFSFQLCRNGRGTGAITKSYTYILHFALVELGTRSRCLDTDEMRMMIRHGVLVPALFLHSLVLAVASLPSRKRRAAAYL